MNRNMNGASQQAKPKEQEVGTITFTIDLKHYERLRIDAFKKNVSKSEYVRNIIINHFKKSK